MTVILGARSATRINVPETEALCGILSSYLPNFKDPDLANARPG